MGKWVVLGVVLTVSMLFFTGIVSFRNLCGFKPGKMAGPGKEWGCHCVGVIEELSTSYSEKQYCTGLNLSYNRLMGLVSSDVQRPIYKAERL
jgi:hypothetical protein